jgi:hypothetical protein
MIPPINNVHGPVTQQVSQPPVIKPQTHPQTPPVAKSGELSGDQVTLKSAGQSDSEGGRD